MPLWWGDMMSSLQALTPLAALIAAILAWLAKLWWSKEFAAAKDAEIAALKTQVGNLTNAHAELVKAKDAEIAAVRAQSGAVSLTKDEAIKAKEAEIAAIRAQVTVVSSAKDDALRARMTRSLPFNRKYQV
jgi:hypothetical protein